MRKGAQFPWLQQMLLDMHLCRMATCRGMRHTDVLQEQSPPSPAGASKEGRVAQGKCHRVLPSLLTCHVGLLGCNGLGGGVGLGGLQVGQAGLQAGLHGVGNHGARRHEVLTGGTHLEQVDSARVTLLHGHPGADGQRVWRPGPSLYDAPCALHRR